MVVMALQLMGFVLSQSEGLRGSRYFPSHPTSLRIATIHFVNRSLSSGNLWKGIFNPLSS